MTSWAGTTFQQPNIKSKNDETSEKPYLPEEFPEYSISSILVYVIYYIKCSVVYYRNIVRGNTSSPRLPGEKLEVKHTGMNLLHRDRRYE